MLSISSGLPAKISKSKAVQNVWQNKIWTVFCCCCCSVVVVMLLWVPQDHSRSEIGLIFIFQYKFAIGDMVIHHAQYCSIARSALHLFGIWHGPMWVAATWLNIRQYSWGFEHMWHQTVVNRPAIRSLNAALSCYHATSHHAQIRIREHRATNALIHI